MRAQATLQDIREQVLASRLSHVPTNFCFLYNGHALDPNVEGTIPAASVAVTTTAPDTRTAQYVVLIDNVHCVIASKTFIGTMTQSIGLPAPSSPTVSQLLLLVAFLVGALVAIVYLAHVRGKHSKDGGGREGTFVSYSYNRVPSSEAQEAQALMDSEGGGSDKNSDKAESCDKRIPCLPAARLHLRPMFKGHVFQGAATHAVARLPTKYAGMKGVDAPLSSAELAKGPNDAK